MKEFETIRLKLIKPSQDYLKEFFDYAKKPHIGPMAGWMPHESILESKHVIDEMISSGSTWFIVLKDTNEFVGTIDLRPVEMHVIFRPTIYELGFAIDDIFWGQGITVEASKALIKYGFEQLNLKEIIVKHMEQNIQSKRVIEKLGFTFEKAEYDETTRTYTTRVWSYKMTKYDYDRRKKYENLKA